MSDRELVWSQFNFLPVFCGRVNLKCEIFKLNFNFLTLQFPRSIFACQKDLISSFYTQKMFSYSIFSIFCDEFKKVILIKKHYHGEREVRWDTFLKKRRQQKKITFRPFFCAHFSFLRRDDVFSRSQRLTRNSQLKSQRYFFSEFNCAYLISSHSCQHSLFFTWRWIKGISWDYSRHVREHRVWKWGG